MHWVFALFFLNSIFFVGTVFGSQGNPVMIDRMILNIGAKNYSQRHFEIYVAVKALVLGKSAKIDYKVNKANWREFLEAYRDDMIIAHHAEIDSGFNHQLHLRKPAIDAAMKVMQKSLERRPEVKTWWAHFEADQTELNSVVVEVLLVQSYLRNKEPSAKNSDELYWGRAPDASSGWFKRMKQQTNYRFYDGALTYQSLKVLP